MNTPAGLLVVALGGNAVAPPAGDTSLTAERRAIATAMTEIGGLADTWSRLLLVHGNGPQIGRLLDAHGASSLHDLDVHVAQTQGELGYLLADALDRALGGEPTAALITRVIVDSEDDAFSRPTKPIGTVLSRPPWGLPCVRMPDGRGWRRIVASPRPLAVVEFDAIRTLLATRHVVAGGGGGVALRPTPFLLDVRTPLEFESARIEDSANIPLDQLDARADDIPAGADVVVVCRTGVRATIAADLLARAGRRARVLDGGVQSWRRAGLPLREGRKRLPVDRQVQLIAGSMVLAGVGLGAFINPWFLAIAAFFGAGLTFAGATGTCGMARLLMRMPWNRPLAGPEGAGAVCAVGATATPTCAAPVARGRPGNRKGERDEGS